MTGDELTDRLEGIESAAGGPLDGSDLPEGHSDPIAYFTDGNGEWDDLKYARVMCSARGPEGSGWVALADLDEIEREIDWLEAQYSQLWTRRRDDPSSERCREANVIAEKIEASGEYVDRRIFDAIRAQIVSLVEAGNRSPKDE